MEETGATAAAGDAVIPDGRRILRKVTREARPFRAVVEATGAGAAMEAWAEMRAKSQSCSRRTVFPAGSLPNKASTNAEGREDEAGQPEGAAVAALMPAPRARTG